MLELSDRQFWTVVHGLVLGTIFLLLFGGGLAGLWSLRPGFLTTAGVQERMRRLRIGMWAMAATAWATVITGTWIVYPWYREALAVQGEDDYAGCAGAVLPTWTCSPATSSNRTCRVTRVLAQLQDGVEGAHRVGRAVPGDGGRVHRRVLRGEAHQATLAASGDNRHVRRGVRRGGHRRFLRCFLNKIAPIV